MFAFRFHLVLVERFDADAVLNAIESFHGTWMLGLPVMFVELLRRQRSQPRMVDSLEFCAVAGDVCPAKVQFPHVFGIPPRTLWGSTEVPGSLIHGLQPGPVSRIAPGAQVRLLDDNGMQVSRGEVGEMLIRGPNATIGYWVGPDRIDPATVEGWYATGDLMRQGEQDDLWFISRKKDLIIRGGSNIWPAEVERVLLDHPAVTDAAVVGVPDADLGERVVGFVCLAPSWSQYLIDDVLAKPGPSWPITRCRNLCRSSRKFRATPSARSIARRCDRCRGGRRTGAGDPSCCSYVDCARADLGRTRAQRVGRRVVGSTFYNGSL